MTIKPTELERRVGRLLRGPDGHGDVGAGGDGGSNGADNSGQANQGDNQGAGGDKDAGDAGAAGNEGGQTGGEAGQGGDGDNAGGDTTSLIGQAAAKARAGKGKDGGDGGEGGDGQDGDDKGDGADDGKDDADVPEAYDLSGLKVTLKDDKGEDVEADLEIDTALLDMATPHLKEAKLSNDQAKALAPLVLGIKERALADQNTAYEAMAADWAKQARADKEIGGKNWSATEHNIGRALDRYGSPELETLLEESRLGNHPAFVKAFAKVGADLGEDEGAHRGGGLPSTKKDREVVLYPDDQPKS